MSCRAGVVACEHAQVRTVCHTFSMLRFGILVESSLFACPFACWLKGERINGLEAQLRLFGKVKRC